MYVLLCIHVHRSNAYRRYVCFLPMDAISSPLFIFCMNWCSYSRTKWRRHENNVVSCNITTEIWIVCSHYREYCDWVNKMVTVTILICWYDVLVVFPTSHFPHNTLLDNASSISTWYYLVVLFITECSLQQYTHSPTWIWVFEILLV